MTEFTKLNMESVADHVYGIEKMGTQKISVFSEQTNSTNSFQQQHKKEDSDSFVLDIENFSHTPDRNTAQNSKINLQRNLSRKGSIREKKPNSTGTTTNEKDNTNPNTNFVASPRASLVGVNTPESSVTVVMGTADLLSSSNTQAQHQITVTAGNGNISSNNAESKYAFRRNSFRRPSSSSWTIDPRKVLFFFATFSSMGTIILIYFTLTMRKHEGNQDWFQ